MRVVQRRGEVVETAHQVSAVLVRADGAVVEREGAALVVPWRSSAKPFQMEGSLSLLPRAVVEGLSSVELALGTSSHSGEPEHLVQVGGLGARLGVAEAALMCGAVWPFGQAARRAALAAGASPRPYHSDCSGKHSFMAAASAAQGWEPDYRPPNHPLQVHLLRRIQDLTEGAVVGTVPDGCGVPSFVLSLDGMALAWARFGALTARGEGDLGRIGAAMKGAPWFVGGTQRVDSALLEGTPLLAKIGAAGLMCLALPEAGLGLAVRVHSGACDARPAAVRAALDLWLPGVLPAGLLDPWCTVSDDIGRLVGRWEVDWAS
ncbi:MAG: asparaginase [Deltaproteobacteria bacterium]|nr:asparaginase [Deltaproteobacteria bacterium]